MHRTPLTQPPREYWNAQLFEATLDQNLERMREAVYHGADVNHRRGNVSPLHVALDRKEYALVHFLLMNGADPNLPDHMGRASLHYPSLSREIMTLLLDCGADPVARPSRSSGALVSPLYPAMQNGQADMVYQLLEAGACPDINGRPASRATPPIFLNIIGICRKFEALPVVALDDALCKETLFRKDGNGKCPLDNPLVWRCWERIEARLAARGERLTKQELLGTPYLTVAANARALGQLVSHLNRHGEALELGEVLRSEGMAPLLEQHHVPNALFTQENMGLLGSHALRRNLAALPPKGREAVPNRHMLIAFVDAQPQSATNQGR